MEHTLLRSVNLTEDVTSGIRDSPVGSKNDGGGLGGLTDTTIAEAWPSGRHGVRMSLQPHLTQMLTDGRQGAPALEKFSLC